MIAKISTDALRLDQKKPLQTKHQFTSDISNGQATLTSKEYKTKIRSDKVCVSSSTCGYMSKYYRRLFVRLFRNLDRAHTLFVGRWALSRASREI